MDFLPKWVAQHAAAEEIDGLLAIVSPAAVEKAAGALTNRFFDAAIRSLTARLIRVAVPVERQAVQMAIAELRKVKWHRMSEASRAVAVVRATESIAAAGGVTAARVYKVMGNEGPRLFAAFKADAGKKYRSRVRASEADERVVQHALTSQSHFIRDEFGRRRVAASDVARKVVASGIERGISSDAIARELGERMRAFGVARSEPYWRMTSSIFAARSRSYAQLSAMDEAMIESYIFQAVLDEITTNGCRLLHGRKFSVKSQVARFQEVAASPPEAVVDMQPFVRMRKGELFVARGDVETRLAKIEETAVGRKDERGKFSSVASEADLAALGACTPPLHPMCRSTLIADL